MSFSEWTEEEKQAALEKLRIRRVDIEALPQSTSKVALLRALDDVIAELGESARAE
jgi:hypothetical protein